MNDLISRRQAIEPEAISKWKKEFREYVDSLDIARDDWKGIIEYIDELPSIQPDTTIYGSNVVKKGINDEDRTTNDLISRQQAVDALHCRFADGFEEDRWWNSTHVIAALKGLPAVPPERKGTRLSTVCLLCKKPAVSFNTEDDIPYTNYSYCEDCLRKGLKLLREQKKNLQTQPERKTGRWIYGESEVGNDGYYCSECGNFVPWIYEESVMNFIREYKFCPNCGARMEGGEADE